MPTNRIQHLIAVAGLVAVLAALAVAVPLTSSFGTASDAAKADGTKQRVAIVSKGVENASGSGEFVLIPLEAGALTRDSGPESAVWSARDVTREGQRVTINRGVETLKGKRGTLKIRYRIEWVDAGNRYQVGTGTWKILRGTAQYDQIAGGGRRGDVWLDRGPGPWSGRAEGFLALPG
jgi:hypothetical protein